MRERNRCPEPPRSGGLMDGESMFYDYPGAHAAAGVSADVALPVFDGRQIKQARVVIAFGPNPALRERTGAFDFSSGRPSLGWDQNRGARSNGGARIRRWHRLIHIGILRPRGRGPRIIAFVAPARKSLGGDHPYVGRIVQAAMDRRGGWRRCRRNPGGRRGARWRSSWW